MKQELRRNLHSVSDVIIPFEDPQANVELWKERYEVPIISRNIKAPSHFTLMISKKSYHDIAL